MAMQINTNILSMTAQRNVGMNESRLGTAIERLSTGLRINSARDDAAGMAISERFTSQIRGQTVAQRNANDAISLAQTAEGALGVLGDALQRMRELTVQSLNGMNTDGDRAAIQQEIVQLREEIERIAQDTTFNGKEILNGTLGAMNFQIGSERGDVLAITGLDARASALTGTQKFEVTADVSALDFSTLAGDLDINGTVIDLRGAANSAEAVDLVNNAFDGSVQAQIVGNTIEISSNLTALTFSGADAATLDLVTGDVGDQTLLLSQVSVATVFDANNALVTIDSAIDQVTGLRAELGAMQNRFENVVEVISVHRENLEAARSRIRDADFAAETANLTRAQILQQAGISSLAQANSAPQSVLSLLQ